MTPDQLFENNIGLVYYVAKRYASIYLENPNIRDDMIQEGFLALWRACQLFDESKGNSFSTYATTSIRNKMVCFAVRYLKRQSTLVSLEDPINTDEKEPLVYKDIIADEQSDVQDIITHDQIFNIAEQLGETAKSVLLKLIEGCTQDEIAKIVGISQPTVSRTIKKIRERIRNEQ